MRASARLLRHVLADGASCRLRGAVGSQRTRIEGECKVGFAQSFVKRQLMNALARWRWGVSDPERAVIGFLVTGVLLYGLYFWAESEGLATPFWMSVTPFILTGRFFIQPMGVLLVAVSVVLGRVVIPAYFGDAQEAWRAGDIASVVVILAIIAGVWWWSRHLSGGMIDDIQKRMHKRR